MNAGPVSERVYAALREHLTNGAYRPGDRLDPGVLADLVASSVTPVREVLNQLAGERLVEARTSDGFRLRQLDAIALADLYNWAGSVAAVMLGYATQLSAAATAPPDIAALFDQLGNVSDNAEHADMAQLLNARLALARRVEAAALPDAGADFAILAGWFAAGDRAALRRGLAVYHRRRAAAAAGIVRAMTRAERIL